jgi:hypothetical protein
MSNPYAAIDREAIWAGLFTYLKAQLASQFQVMGRKHIAPPALTMAEQPALFQVVGREVRMPQKVPGTPSRLVLRGFLILYVFDKSPEEFIGAEMLLPETTLNNLLKAIDTAVAPDNFTTGKFTIGGLVTHCWIEGDVDLDPGIFGPQAAALLPLNLLV